MVQGTRGWIARVVACVGLALTAASGADPDLWSLGPVARPGVPSSTTSSPNPIDAFLASEYRAKGLEPAGPADKQTLLRRVTLDLTGLPPTPAEQAAFLHDESPNAYETVVDRLLASEQHGVRFGRHWLDVLRYADVDERMVAAPGIHLWRDWVIRALNDDVPYDQFVRAQLTGYRTTERTQMSATGHRSRKEPRPDDLFALGLLARGAVIRDGKDDGELPIAAVETVSAAFMGMTVACAKCHDHMYDPIKQRDYYAMKALFDPLIVRKVTLASPAEILAEGKAIGEVERKREMAQGPIDDLLAPYKKRLYDDRVAMLPPDVQAVIHKPERQRSAAEQKIADDYFPVLRIDTGNILEIMPEPDRKKYRELQARLDAAGGRRGSSLPAFWTVEVDPKREAEPSYILTSGDPERPEKDHAVTPGWPFAPSGLEFREGRIEAFSDWLTAPDNPLFARVVVNRLWQWHFGEGLHKTPSDFGVLGGTPSNPALLDWLASEFVSRGFGMKAMHRLMVTSEAYKRASDAASDVTKANTAIDPTNAQIWRFPLRRLDAESIWDAIWTAAGGLDATVGGPSFDPAGAGRSGPRGGSSARAKTNRRAAYMIRGYSTSRDVVPNFLQAFDVDDGRVPCPVRTRTVSPPQALFLMNSDPIEKATEKFAERLKAESGGDLGVAVDLAYRIAVARPPTASERDRALAYLDHDPTRLKGLGWLVFNLDEFLYVR
ncbi:DUF1549 and DUF1553 domain-containing protein [Paludisphaera borealis]|uniref:Cytochrome c domain-containing protein n=1 Tax=Paludisphaera borealis TaxID=1387353 RepID=A0A1U7CUR8_9BACT|nr:DUF1549 and DUF1553 domain-containing protein [Paludisphaera borealis]APW62671.1 hypothetical protein BSF38_04221 [Paludisphaera borealis]